MNRTLSRVVFNTTFRAEPVIKSNKEKTVGLADFAEKNAKRIGILKNEAPSTRIRIFLKTHLSLSVLG